MSFTTHAAERAAERYGLTATAADWSRAVLDIIDSCEGIARTATLLRRLDDGLERWLVRVGTKPLVAVYSPTQALIVTVLPPTTPHGALAGYSRQRRAGRGRHERPTEEDWGC